MVLQKSLQQAEVSKICDVWQNTFGVTLNPDRVRDHLSKLWPDAQWDPILRKLFSKTW
jgi:hypothetical protein